MTALLETQHLSAKAYGVSLLSDISLQVKAAEVLAIIGPNGAGKTSLLRALSGDLAGTTEVRLAGQTLSSYEAGTRARQMAVLAQQNDLSFPFIARDVVAMGRIVHSSGQAVDAGIVDAALAAMDITYLADRAYTRLSGGEQQRVHLARVMAQVWRSEDAPQRVLLLDEPTSSLDVSHAHQLMQTLQRFAKTGVAVVMIVHDFNLAARYCQRIIALSYGRIAAQGSPNEVINAATLETLFGVKATIVPHPNTGQPLVFIDG